MRRLLIILLLTFLVNGVFANPWDFLRIVPETAALINPILIWALLLTSIIILIISIISLKKTKSQRLLFVTIAFTFFFINSFLNVVDFYFSPGYFMNFAVQGLFDFLVILSLFIAIFRK